jgi:hypothetical protein
MGVLVCFHFNQGIKTGQVACWSVTQMSDRAEKLKSGITHLRRMAAISSTISSQVGYSLTEP